MQIGSENRKREREEEKEKGEERKRESKKKEREGYIKKENLREFDFTIFVKKIVLFAF